MKKYNIPASDVKHFSSSLVLPGNRSQLRRDYDRALEERVDLYLNQGEVESEAWESALTDLGDFSHWRWLRTMSTPSPVEPCGRCGKLLIQVGQAFTISAVGGSPVTFFVCARCVSHGLGADERLEVAA
jgi:hypothetical protein